MSNFDQQHPFQHRYPAAVVAGMILFDAGSTLPGQIRQIAFEEIAADNKQIYRASSKQPDRPATLEAAAKQQPKPSTSPYDWLRPNVKACGRPWSSARRK